MQPHDAETLKRIAASIEDIRDQMDTLKSDEKEYFDEAKQAGLDTTALRQAIAKKRKRKSQKAVERDEKAALYFEVLDGGLFARQAAERLGKMAAEDGGTAHVETPDGKVIELGGAA